MGAGILVLVREALKMEHEARKQHSVMVERQR
jgi:hypothetical protein